MWEVKMKLVLKTKLGWAIFFGGEGCQNNNKRVSQQV